MNYGDFVLAVYIFCALIIFFSLAYLAEKFVFKTNFWKKLINEFEKF